MDFLDHASIVPLNHIELDDAEFTIVTAHLQEESVDLIVCEQKTPRASARNVRVA
jgi:hypothetical protein